MAGKGLPGPVRRPLLLLLPALLVLSTASQSESDALVEFKSTLSANGGDEALRSWTPGSGPCSDNHTNWRGVLCTNGKVWGLQLEGMHLSGKLNLTALSILPSLRALSFMNNDLVGPMPDISIIKGLKALYLSNNQLSGEVPDGAFGATRSLKKIFMSNNEFTGKLPSSLTQLSKLMFMRVDDNRFEGEIPDLTQANLRLLNVSYNKFSGKIPESISDMDPSLFAGNDQLCGPPLAASCPSPPPPPLPPPPPKKKKSSSLLWLWIVIGVILSILAVVVIILLFCRRSSSSNKKTLSHRSSVVPGKTVETVDAADKLEQGSVSGGGSVGGRRSRDTEHGKLSFIKDDKANRFELSDLLRASAEVLGSGNFGSSYKAVIVNGPSVVVKRFKEMNRIGREDFQEHMRRLGRLSHPNVLPLVAYYYRKEEKLIITNYILNGSLAHMLHGNRGSNLPPLDWMQRLRIIKGVARGLSYLYEELPMLTLPHGHLKSSNVLITDTYDCMLTDYALVPVVNQSHASQVMVAYKSPEFTETGKPSKKSDVWSFGILILEVMTGKFPATYLQKGKASGTDLAAWVNTVAKEEVFDSEMKRRKSDETQMTQMLQIGLACCEVCVDKRWEMKEALDKIEELKERENEEDASALSEVELGSTNLLN